MRKSVDSEFYISGAQNLINGELPKGREVLYVSYMSLLAIISLLGLEPESIVFIHFIAEILALYSAYQLAKRLTDSHQIAITAPLIYVLWFKFQQWNLIVYTDALFSHMVVISIYALVASRSIMEKIGVFVLILFTAFLRPTGLGLLLASILFLYKVINNKWKVANYYKVPTLVLCAIFFIWFLNMILSYFVDSFFESYQMAEIIYPKIKFIVEAPTSLHIPDNQHIPIVRLFMFIIKNPIYFIKISTIKGLLFIGHVKPYYSIMHNVFIVGFLYPIYFLSIRGYLSMKKSGVKLLMSSFIIIQILIVCFTSENWDGRFLLPVIPLTFIFSSVGISSFLPKKVELKN